MVNILVSLQGAELAAQDAKCAAALAACRTLAEELSESRFPTRSDPCIQGLVEFQSSNRKLCTFIISPGLTCTKDLKYYGFKPAGGKLPGSVFCFSIDTGTQGPTI